MLGKRPRPFLPARLGLGLVSVLALLALIPASAVSQATDETGIPQYEDAPPVPTGEKESDRPGSAGTSNTDGGQGGQAGAGSGSNGNSPGGSSPGAGASGKGRDGNAQGSPGSGKNQAKPLQPGEQAGVAASTEDDGGSSPLVPILIAVLVLAAISVGAVMWNKRRQQADSGSSVSPEAN